MNKPKREHHVTPRLYLKGFVIKFGEPFIWVYKRAESYYPGDGKVTNNPYKASINVVGVERDFYANSGLNGKDRFEAFENDLETLEKPSNSILPKLLAGHALSAKEKTAFAGYIIQFSRRGAAGRETVNLMSPKTVLEYEPPDELYAKARLPKTAESRLILKAMVLEVAAKPGYSVHMHHGVLNASATSFMAQALDLMTWHLLKAPAAHPFFTCDNPVFYDTAAGMGSSLSEMTFPLSSRYALLASWWKLSDRFVVEAVADEVKEINLRTVHNAVKHLYSGGCDESTANVFGNSTYKFRPICPAKSALKVAELIKTGPQKGYLKLNVRLPLCV